MNLLRGLFRICDMTPGKVKTVTFLVFYSSKCALALVIDVSTSRTDVREMEDNDNDNEPTLGVIFRALKT